MSRFGALLRQHRRATEGRVRANRWGPAVGGLSMNALAKRAGIDPSYVLRMERGTQAPTRPVVDALAYALDLSADDHDRLLVAAGYWPWPSLDDDAEGAVLRVGALLADRAPASAERAS